MSSPIKFCGLSIPTFAHRAERLLLAKRNALKTSKNIAIRELWSSTHSAHANYEIDQRITGLDYSSASKQLRDEQSSAALSHFLGLPSQGRMYKTVGELIPLKHINCWKVTIEQLPTYAFNFVRKP